MPRPTWATKVFNDQIIKKTIKDRDTILAGSEEGHYVAIPNAKLEPVVDLYIDIAKITYEVMTPGPTRKVCFVFDDEEVAKDMAEAMNRARRHRKFPNAPNTPFPNG